MSYEEMGKNKMNSYFYYNNSEDIFCKTESLIKDSSSNHSCIIIPHVCNNISVFGGGFAKDVGDRYPIVRENFLALGKKESKLGKVQYIDVYTNNNSKTKLVFANMIAQNGVKSEKNIRPLNYNALVYCMNDIIRFCSNLKTNHIENIEIHCPKFGSGLAGGNWFFIQDLIKDIWHHYPVYIYNKQDNKLKFSTKIGNSYVK